MIRGTGDDVINGDLIVIKKLYEYSVYVLRRGSSLQRLTEQHFFVEITSFYKSNVGKKNTFTVTNCGLIYLYRELLLSQLAQKLAFNIRRHFINLSLHCVNYS